ncbi:hypothetical protein [Blastococcus capsensis]|uniref:hypothetical protein n=1 Tax=Blastococcus capsensis TaxID=1564163 RepID=UPI002541BE0A|nr:hypothetical protein [Blastococcus capsensis]MDK3257665.1 hypothetical protein [Blastococcus capsensis]
MSSAVPPVQPLEQQARTVDLVRWGPVIAGAVIGLAVYALFNALWLALASSTGNGWVSDNLGWFVGGTAAGALLLAGFLAGLLAGARGAMAGLVNGLTAWGLLFLLTLTAVVPGALDLSGNLAAGLEGGTQEIGSGLGSAGGGFTVETALWTGFWSLLAGLVLAVLGGILGGKVRRPVKVAAARTRNDAPVAAPTEPTSTGPATAPTAVVTGNHVVDRAPGREETLVGRSVTREEHIDR